jgi:hypothetical protein
VVFTGKDLVHHSTGLDLDLPYFLKEFSCVHEYYLTQRRKAAQRNLLNEGQSPLLIQAVDDSRNAFLDGCRTKVDQ